VTGRALLIMAIPLLCGIAGIGLLVASNVMYARRTHDPQLLGRFWLHRTLLTPREHLLNRVGFSLAVATIPLILAAGLLIGLDAK
jgi:hypothetical protein